MCHGRVRSKSLSLVPVQSQNMGAMANLTYELVWIQDILIEMSFVPNTPMRLYWNNILAIFIVHNPVFYERIKHIVVDCHVF